MASTQTAHCLWHALKMHIFRPPTYPLRMRPRHVYFFKAYQGIFKASQPVWELRSENDYLVFRSLLLYSSLSRDPKNTWQIFPNKRRRLIEDTCIVASFPPNIWANHILSRISRSTATSAWQAPRTPEPISRPRHGGWAYSWCCWVSSACLPPTPSPRFRWSCPSAQFPW